VFPSADIIIPEEIRYVYEFLRSKKILGDLTRRSSFPDEPQIPLFLCEYKNKNRQKAFGAGGNEDENTAIIQSIAEAIEYYCLIHERQEFFFWSSYNKLDRKAVDPLRFIPFAQFQLNQNKYRRFVITHQSEINWLEGFSLTAKNKVLIPASLAYAKYDFRKEKEPAIRVPISTGAACGPSISFALYRGLCEIIERDAYMISFFPGMKKKLVSINQDCEVFSMKRRIERYNFEVYYFDTSLDTSVTTIVCLILDRSGSGPAVSAGLGGDLNPAKAIKTASIEAVRSHISNRSLFFNTNKLPPLKKYSLEWFRRKKHQLWNAPHMIHKAKEFIDSSEVIQYYDLKNRSQSTNEKNIEIIKYELQKLDCEVLYVDMTISEVSASGLRVIKVLCPEMVPLWHDDRFPYLGMRRLDNFTQNFRKGDISEYSSDDFLKAYPF
jgi:ribosomal protein S12 methylthiotransferase accessory factor